MSEVEAEIQQRVDTHDFLVTELPRLCRSCGFVLREGITDPAYVPRCPAKQHRLDEHLLDDYANDDSLDHVGYQQEDIARLVGREYEDWQRAVSTGPYAVATKVLEVIAAQPAAVPEPSEGVEMTQERLAGNLRAAVKASGLTQQQVAERMDLDPTVLSKMLAGKRRVTSLELALLCTATGTDVLGILEADPLHGPSYRAGITEGQRRRDAGTVTEAVERLMRSRMTWGTHTDRWADAEWQRGFWTEVAQVVLGVEPEAEGA